MLTPQTRIPQVASGALLNNIAGPNNTANGVFALFDNTTGDSNTATGLGTLGDNTTGSFNTADGANGLIGGFYNTADGVFALLSNTEGAGNTDSGYQALFSNQDGANNASYGYIALARARGARAPLNNTASFNTAFGSQTLVFNTMATENAAIGYQALAFNTTAAGNTANGYQALSSNTTGDFATATGSLALFHNITGDGNTAIGRAALFSNTSGSNNIDLGNGAGQRLTTGDDNVDIGNIGVAGENSTIRIRTFQTAAYLAGIAGQTVGAGGTTCYVDNDGKLGVFLSARRFKTDIADMGNASEALLALRPVTFHYKPELDNTGIPQFGLVAEEVAKVNPDLVTHDAKGELSTVRYEAVNAMLLNEFLKEHRTVQELKSNAAKQEATIGQQQKQIEALTAGLQNVSAQLEAGKPGTQTALNNNKPSG